MQLEQIIDNIYRLPEQSRVKLLDCFDTVDCRKGFVLFRYGWVEKHLYFIKSGIARAFSDSDGTEITFWFGSEGDPVISMKSYVAAQPGYENIELLEDCELYRTEVSVLQRLFETDVHIANWGRKFAERELVATEERFISRQFRTASQRYQELLASRPELVRRVALGHIASYLGITQVSLSRIRSELK